MEIDILSIVLALSVGISLSAACGFRVFIPLLVMAIAARFFNLAIDENLKWVCSDAAIICLGAACFVETLAYYLPGIDNLLDTIAGPAALVAGAFVTAGMLGDLPDWLQWGTGIIAGAGAAGSIQVTTTAVRGASTMSSAGAGNPIVSTAENTMATIGSILAVAMPFLAVAGAILLIFLAFFFLKKIRALIARRRMQAAPTA